ncbi:hypothetical protein [Pseudomonas donghuensis]|uniref:hypothetical protein n=1 Tax=Pseudomonas donghuensis TaxID=1163398 RepID=UPI0020C51566|nr:hypothetical protein [Pseudomonas donghuensis]MCP6691304.1 hypothetical protein [Pseudomonas donghuensis]
MPTENRSSNTEQMVSVPMSTLEKCLRDANLVRFTCDKHVLLLQDLLSQPAAQHQGEPILIQAVAVSRKDDDEGLRLEWLLEGGITEMEFPGQVLFAMAEANDLCDEDGSAYVHLQPPTSAESSEVERLRTVIERQKALITSLRADLQESISITDVSAPTAGS